MVLLITLKERPMPADDERPDPALVWKAIDVYMVDAYDGHPPPATVRSMLALLRGSARCSTPRRS